MSLCTPAWGPTWALAGVCGAFVVAAAAIGIIAMTDKKSSAKPAPKKTAAALSVPRRQQHRLVA